MKTHAPLRWLTCLALLGCLWPVSAQETAVVKDGRINVRGQPSLVGEVITQLQKGEKVTVLEQITVAKPKTNEPPRWARIQMPANTPVWVYAPFVDPTEKTVKVSRLNLRAGPGENYSVVGRLERGAKVSEIRRVEDWMEVETPAGAYAFVAADLLIPSGQAGALSATKPETAAVPPTQGTAPSPAPASTPDTAPPLTPPAPAPEPHVTQTTPELQTPSSVASAPVIPVTPPSPALEALPAPVVTLPDTAPPSAATSVAPEPSRVPSTFGSLDNAPLIKRIVRREGLVRSTVSIQAPTYYELLNPQNRKTINFLHTPTGEIKLKDYRGRRIIVTGEEAIDPRWPKTPVIEVETLELIP